jgi:hypothetical protein
LDGHAEIIARSRVSFAPPGLIVLFYAFSHGLRRGLPYAAAPRLCARFACFFVAPPS